MPCVCNAAATLKPISYLQRIGKQLMHIREQLRTGKTRGTKGRSLESHELAFLRVRELELVEKRGLAHKKDARGDDTRGKAEARSVPGETRCKP